MYKLIVFLVAAIPVVLFLKTVFGRSKVLSDASATFRKQVDYLAWAILFLVGCALIYSIGGLIYSFWR